MAESLLHIEGLCAGYGPVQALHDVSLSVTRGELVALIGANGAGKTTTLLCASGIVAARAGKISFAGEDITNLAAHARVGRGLAQVPEGRKIFPRLSVIENLDMGAFLCHDGAEIKRSLERVFSLFPVLAERRSQLGGTLSGGEQQMLAIGRALMSKPIMLLLDEPSMGIAPILTQKIFETIRQLCSEGLTVLVVEQNAQLALSLAAHGYVMETGRIVLVDSGKNLLLNPKVQSAYLGQ